MGLEQKSINLHGNRQVPSLPLLRKCQKNSDYWSSKITRNKSKDIDVSARLSKNGCSVVGIWGCELKQIEVLKEKLKTWFFNEKV